MAQWKALWLSVAGDHGYKNNILNLICEPFVVLHRRSTVFFCYRSEATSGEVISDESSAAAVVVPDKKSVTTKRKSVRKSKSNPTADSPDNGMKSLSQALEEEFEKPKVSFNLALVYGHLKF